ncbi:MAG: glutamine synthetase III [Clostridia bacterium]|nr:glutamine synthetase III [Clostridia bacterium]MEE1023478.1 glutamine synthetase III [Acutalibacteraceae bacterium]
MSTNVPEMFGCYVFNDKVMKDRLPKETYKALKETVEKGAALDLAVANVVANAMKRWAIDLGATHYTHWFQPMTGTTAGKHDSFISPDGNGNVIMEFSGKELVKGEPDASSFPSGGIRAIFEARGYTAWDPSSYAFVKEGSLYIPTAFCSYTGEALDKKTPLLRSMQVINEAAMKILKLCGNTAKRVTTTVGPEQEYFIIDKEMYLKRSDLMFTGRTLFGAKPPKGQELDDQYFGQLKPKIVEFMRDLDEECWKLGINAKTKHNEGAPAQHEMAPVFSTTNVATDHNQLTMELMKNVADRHGLVCLLHEKPFAGVNGSGKHNNWSLSTNKGENLLNPGKTPYENTQFLLFLAAVIKAVDDYQDLMRISVASAGNDHRLGANEAPPAIISMFLGDELQEVLDAIESGESYEAHEKVVMDLGVSLIPKFKKDNTDRNRTSPFAFTGNKFEFRMLGSSASIADCNTVLNTIVADALTEFYKELKDSTDIVRDGMALIQKTIKAHKRIIFNGNGYSHEWEKEAEERGLHNLKTTPEALATMLDEKNIKLFEKFGVYTKEELEARYEIYMENYCTTISIEALTMIDLIKKQVMPAVMEYESMLVGLVADKAAVGVGGIMEKSLAEKISVLADSMYIKLGNLEEAVLGAKDIEGTQDKGMYYRTRIFLGMQELRAVVDELETLIGSEYWPLPTYAEMLYSVI